MSRPRLRVLTSRNEIAPERLEGATAVVVDVFLATTTLLTILENGARRVFPVRSLEAADEVCAGLDAGSLVRGGEQNALRIEGYDCGPYPWEYERERVSDRDVVFVSTNGTVAIDRAATASQLLLGSLRNAPAVAEHLAETRPEAIYIICAGSGGRLALDDLLGAATILSHLDVGGRHLNDGAWLAMDLAERYRGRIPEVLRAARSGRWFFENGQRETFDFVADIGASDTLAEVRSGQVQSVAERVR
jgi:2-phosphosulfolactate phosphatase